MRSDCYSTTGHITNKILIGTGRWNLRTKNHPGKLSNIEKELKRLHMNVLGIPEVRWIEMGEIATSDGLSSIYLVGNTATAGMEILIKTLVARCLMGNIGLFY